MNTVAIDRIWQAILESERSDDIQFMDDEVLIKTARLARPRLDQPDAMATDPTTTAAPVVQTPTSVSA
jgi:hypothetical protein